ncbi:MAG: hypothetical protein ACRES4_09855, partial [Nevskiales bacterium]
MYQVVFTGRLLKGADRATVESELQRLFKASATQVEWFLRGKPIVVKSCDDALLAGRYYDTLTKAGLECELRSDQSASASMTPPPEDRVAPREQLPIPGVSAPPPRSASAPRAPAQRRAPTLGPITQAITGKDRAPVFSPVRLPPALASAPVAAPPSLKLRTGLTLLFLLVGAVLVGTLAYFVRQEWQVRHAPAPAGESGKPAVAAPTAVSDPPSPSPSPEPSRAVQKALTPETLIVGRWQCVEAASGRMVESEFMPDGRYRSLTQGKSDAFQHIDQIDVLVEGRYWLEGDTVVLHVQNIP